VAIAASGVVALCAGTLWIAWPREVTHRFVPGPQGSVVHFEAVAHRRVSGYGPAQPYGIWGRRYSWDPIESTATICTDLEVGSWYPLPLRPESPAVLGPGYISVDGQGNVDLRSGERVVVRLPLRIDPAHLPETYDRDETAGGRIARNSDTGTQVTVFGAVEVVADSKVNSLAWDPDAAGRFTRFWERTTTEALGRYRPPFTFDRVDYRTRNWNPMLKTFEPAWSTAGFLYRQSDEIVGVYWPDLVHCTPAGGPVLRFRHVFGTVSGGALTELTAIDDIGQRWRIGEVERFVCFMPNGSTLFDDVTVGQDGPADWLRYFIHGLSNILRPGHPAPVRIQ
jgi:hypothetical protein